MTTRSRFAALLLAGLLACSTLAPPATALAVSDDAVLQNMDAALEENTRLREESWRLHKGGDRETARHTAEALAASEVRLERARTEALAHVAGINPAQVEGLRKEGKSWGQASSELGVHPGFLGIGKEPLYEAHSMRKGKAGRHAAKNGKRGKKNFTPQKATAAAGHAKPAPAKDRLKAKQKKSAS